MTTAYVCANNSKQEYLWSIAFCKCQDCIVSESNSVLKSEEGRNWMLLNTPFYSVTHIIWTILTKVNNEYQSSEGIC